MRKTQTDNWKSDEGLGVPKLYTDVSTVICHPPLLQLAAMYVVSSTPQISDSRSLPTVHGDTQQHLICIYELYQFSYGDFEGF